MKIKRDEKKYPEKLLSEKNKSTYSLIGSTKFSLRNKILNNYIFFTIKKENNNSIN